MMCVTDDKVADSVHKYFKTMRSNYRNQSGVRQVEKENRKEKKRLRKRERRAAEVYSIYMPLLFLLISCRGIELIGWLEI